ncbi:hypothetical protein ACF0H2_07715 [Serratia marcescens]
MGAEDVVASAFALGGQLVALFGVLASGRPICARLDYPRERWR